jgi:membrane protease YdiL (CAAX protease family)
VKKLISFHKTSEKLSPVISALILALALLAIIPGTASAGNFEHLSSALTGPVSDGIFTGIQQGATDYGFTLLPYENPSFFQKIGGYVDIIYMFGGICAGILILLTQRHITALEQKLTENSPEILYSNKFPNKYFEVTRFDEISQEIFGTERFRLFTLIPVLFIALAELFIFSGRMGLAVWIHIGIIIGLSLSNMLIKDLKIHRIYQALMLLPVLRLINLSMPVFFETTLYAFVFIYSPLAIPLAVIVMHQRNSLEEIGITTKNFLSYVALSLPLSFLLGLGEYLTIRTGYLIPDLSFESLLKLTIIMVFFVGLVEELIFRSILQTRLEQALSVKEALLITSILLGLMHSGYGTFHEILYTGFVGLLMGFAFYKTRSLPFIVLMHGFINVFLFGILPHYLSSWTPF